MPDRAMSWDGLVRGEVSFAAEHVPDFVIVRGNGEPLYTLVNPVDDALMEITHVLRGEDLLSSTPRQLAMYEALAAIGVGDGSTPRFGHLPYVMGEGNKKLSKRDPPSSLNLYREEGYLPEGLLNYLALLGWSPGDDLEFFSPHEMATLFDITRVQPNPARFDSKKCLAINGDWIRHVSAADLAGRLVPYLDAVGAVRRRFAVAGDVLGITAVEPEIVVEVQGGMGAAASGNIHPGAVSMFEPIHGSAPKYAGKNVSSPVATVMAVQMMLDYLGETRASQRVEAAVMELVRTKRIPSLTTGALPTDETGDLICETLETVALPARRPGIPPAASPGPPSPTVPRRVPP